MTFCCRTAKDLINRIIAKGQGLPDSTTMGESAVMEEMLIPGNKFGLVIGKGGETIKNLQEQAGVKMVMIQDSNVPSHHDKPLRITGDPSRVQVRLNSNKFLCGERVFHLIER